MEIIFSRKRIGIEQQMYHKSTIKEMSNQNEVDNETHKPLKPNY